MWSFMYIYVCILVCVRHMYIYDTYDILSWWWWWVLRGKREERNIKIKVTASYGRSSFWWVRKQKRAIIWGWFIYVYNYEGGLWESNLVVTLKEQKHAIASTYKQVLSTNKTTQHTYNSWLVLISCLLINIIYALTYFKKLINVN